MKKNRLTSVIGIVLAVLVLISSSVGAYSIGMADQDVNAPNSEDTMENFGPDWYYKPSSYAELVSWYQALEVNYSDYIEVFKANDLYGTNQATGGYDLYYVRITNESMGFRKPEVLVLGSPHGDETAGTIGLYWFTDWLMRMAFTDEPCPEYSKDWLRWLVDNREIYIEVAHNPYGFDNVQRYDGNGWDLNREADHDGPGTPTGGLWASENGKTLRKFVDNHTIRIGSDMHGGVRCLIYPWASTNLNIYGTSPITGYTNEGAPPDFYFYDASALRLGAYMGDCCGDGAFDENNVQTIAEYIYYPVYGGISPWAYAADVIQNPAEDPYVEDEIFGNYPGTGALWISPEMSWTKNVPEYEMGNDTILGWGTEIRRFMLHQADLAQPYVRWQSDTVENNCIVPPGIPLTFEWQVNGSLVVDHTNIQWGTDPNPVNNYDYSTSDYDGNAGNYIGGTGWDGAFDGNTSGITYSENITINTPGEYYFVAKAQVDQIYKNVLEPSTYGNDSYLRLVKERTNASYYESLNGTDGVEEIVGQTWWYSPIIHVTVGGDSSIVTSLLDDWNFISLPFNFSVEKIDLKITYGRSEYNWSDAVAQSIIGDYVFGWDKASQSYSFTDTFEPGYGYWMYAYTNCEIWAENVSLTSDNYITNLETNWNIVAVPHNESVDKTNITVNYGGSDHTWADAVSGGIINDYVFGWDRNTQSYNFADTFMPGYAYWMYAYQPCTLKRTA